MIVLYQYEISPFCDKVRRVLNWKRLPFETREVSMAGTVLGLRKLNPIGKVPALDLDGEPLADSTHIARRLDERFPEPPLYPKEPRARALCHVLEDWADESLYFYEVELRFGDDAEAPRWVEQLTRQDNAAMRVISRFAVPFSMRRVTTSQGTRRKPRDLLLRELRGHLDAVAECLDGAPWLLGPTLTMADIAVFAQLRAIRTTERGSRLFEGAPAVVAWMERVDAATSARA